MMDEERNEMAEAAARIKGLAEQKAAEARERQAEGWEPSPRRDLRAEAAVVEWERSCPELFKHVTWESIQDAPTKEFAEALARTAPWLKNPTGNLIVVGSVGTGKSTLAVAVCHELARTQGWHPRFTTAPGFFDQCRPGGAGVEDFIKRKVLLLDDIGSGRTDLTEFEADRLTRLIDERHLNNRITIVTTNLNASQLKILLGERLFDRLAFNSHTVAIPGSSQRTGRWEDM